MPYRAGNGKFVSKTNPVAVATVARERAERIARAERERAERIARAERARRNGYRGPLTRADLATAS